MALSPFAALAQASPPCRLETIGVAHVRAVSDGRSLTLDDGREVRLADIEVPTLAHSERAAKDVLEGLVAGRSVTLKHSKPERDRYGRLMAHLFVTDDEGERWITQEMIAQGHAQVAARVADRSCLADLLASERRARAAKLGLWASSAHVVRQADQPAEILAQKGRFALIEGKILSVRESGGTVYVNFGRRWSEDFTVTILKRNERAFTTAGMDPKKLDGRRVRVRGWIEERGGPWIEATRPEQIEILGAN
jgi:endonuclease YncB( thermonuclease family)